MTCRATLDDGSSPSRHPASLRMLLLFVILFLGGCASTPGVIDFVTREQRSLDIREPAAISTAPLPSVAPPVTVDAKAKWTGTTMELSLDEALKIALDNAKVVRVLAGTTAVPSGKTIFGPAITNAAVDSARSVFDPVVSVSNVFRTTETPVAVFDSSSPFGASIPGTRIDNYELGLGVSKRLATGATLSFDGTRTHSNFILGPAPLNPQDRSAMTLSLTQPLLQGAGVKANLAPIVIARINTERSFFQLKDSLQELTRSVIEAYWNVVFARTDVWARRQQVEQALWTYQRSEARKKFGLDNDAEVAQTKVALMSFRAGLIGSEANLLDREAALRNLLGLRPTEPERVIPTTPPTPEPFLPKWDEIVQLAGEMRPDLIELALILEADQQAIVQARNQALPKVDASLYYRWNGLEGLAPSAGRIGVGPGGNFADWSAGVNFSVPIGLRDARAKWRNAELVLTEDRANLDQGVHSALHTLAGNLRGLARYYEQYLAYREMRSAARINLERQLADVTKRGAIVLNLLQAITDWGNAVSLEAQALAQYNIELANLARQTGTILETHGIRMAEERAGFVGPLGRLGRSRLYPSSVPPGPNTPRYPDKGEPAEKMLERETPSFKELMPKEPMKKDEKQPPPAQVLRSPRVEAPHLTATPTPPRLGQPQGLER